MEQTYLMIKPDAVQRGLCGEIVTRFEKKGLKLIAMKLMVIPKETAETHYGEHKGKKFYDSLITYITSGPVLAMSGKATTQSRSAGTSWVRRTLRSPHPEPSVETTEWSQA